MDPTLYSWVVAAHGHLAALGLALLLHPVITLWRRRGLATWTLRTAELAAVLLALPYAIGWLVYPTYREHVKPGLLAEHHAWALVFETKEHLAFLCLALAVSGAMALRVGGRHAGVRRAAWVALLGAWLCGVATAVLGMAVRGVAQPGW